VDLSCDRLLMMMTGCGPVVWQITDDDDRLWTCRMTDYWWLWQAVDLSYDRLLMMMTGCGPVVWQITDDDNRLWTCRMTDYWWWWQAVDMSSDRLLMMTGCGHVVWQITDDDDRLWTCRLTDYWWWWKAVDLSSDRLLMMMTGCGPVIWQITEEWIIKGTIFGKQLLDPNMFQITVQILSEIFPNFKKNSAAYYYKFKYFHMSSTHYSSHILIKLEPFRQIFEKNNIRFYKNPFFGSRVVWCGHKDGQTDMTKLTVAFRNFAKAPK
jgi:hypothetical protein